MDKHENDEMSYVWSEKQGIRQDTIHLVSDNIFEKLAYSYAFAQVHYLMKTTIFSNAFRLCHNVNDTRRGAVFSTFLCLSNLFFHCCVVLVRQIRFF